jgi:ribosomal protein S18 acetylase RimI-like enzyme
MNALHISKILPDAVDTLVSVSHTCFLAAYDGQIDPQESLDYLSRTHSREQLGAELMDPTMDYFWVWFHGHIAGFCMLRQEQSHPGLAGEPAVLLNRIYLLPAYWGRGIGEPLMRFCVDYARQRQARWLWLQVWQENKRAIRFYEHMGFTVFGLMDFHLGDTVHADWVMRKLIAESAS